MDFGKNIWNNIKMAMGQPIKMDNVRSGRTFTRGANGSFIGGETLIGDESKSNPGSKYVDSAVNSTAVQSVEWDPKSENAKVMFVGGDKQYDYPMTKQEFKDFQNAPSKGRWINKARTY